MPEDQINPGTPSSDGSHPSNRLYNPVEAAAKQRNILLRVIRGTFVVLMVTVTLLSILQFGEGFSPGLTFDLAARWWLPLTLSCVAAAVFILADILTPNKKLQTFGGIILGLIAGLIVTVALGFVIDLVATSWDFGDNAPIVNTIKILLGISLSYLGISTVLQTQDDFRLVIPYVEFAKQLRGHRPLLLDTSAIIDARIADLGETGIIQTPVVVPLFVINELQALADSADGLKRAKGRRGLSIVTRLQSNAMLDITIDETPIPGKAVDQMLVELATQVQGMIVTGDIALSRIAGFRNVPVLNINDLANALKPALVPGETLTIHLLKPGEQPGQAVGYLDDGTMVVAEDGGPAIGTEVTLTVRSSLQTAAGRMIFGRVGHDDPQSDRDFSNRAADQPQPTSNGGSKPDRAGDVQSAPSQGPFPPNPPARSKHQRNPRR